MKKYFTIFCLLFQWVCGSAQSTYNSTSYASVGDTVYLTVAQPDTTNFYNGGAGYIWNFGGLKGISQQNVVFRNPKSTGFTQLQWPYIYNTANVNLSSTNGQSVALGPLQETNNNDYYLIGGSTLAEKASSFSVVYNNLAFNIKNTFTSPDTLYRFPLQYADTFASTASYATTLPGIYYNMQKLQRTNKVDGWGTVITPYGSFSHCLRVVSDVVQADTFAIDGVGLPADTLQYREIKWLDSTTNYPVLYVKQTLAGGMYVTTQVMYYDKQEYFQPQALFAYLPLLPAVNDTVTFQNLSVNSTAYKWFFGDGDSSLIASPQHVYTAAGNYSVKLIAYNGSLSDTVVIVVRVSSNPVALFAYTPALPLVSDTVTFQNLSLNATAYKWFFGDGDNSLITSPQHVYTQTGTFAVQLVAFNGSLTDTLVIYIKISAGTLPIKLLSFSAATTKAGNNLQWSTAKETNTASFTLERSTDGKNFTAIAVVMAAGNSNNTQYYSYNDAGYPAGPLYYRLKITNMDGNVSYSGVVLLKDAAAQGLKILLYPNPADRYGGATLSITSSAAANVIVAVYGADGKLVLSKSISSGAGTNVISLPLNDFTPGAYFLFCGNETGTIGERLMFIVTK